MQNNRFDIPASKNPSLYVIKTENDQLVSLKLTNCRSVQPNIEIFNFVGFQWSNSWVWFFETYKLISYTFQLPNAWFCKSVILKMTFLYFLNSTKLQCLYLNAQTSQFVSFDHYLTNQKKFLNKPFASIKIFNYFLVLSSGKRRRPITMSKKIIISILFSVRQFNWFDRLPYTYVFWNGIGLLSICVEEY